MPIETTVDSHGRWTWFRVSGPAVFEELRAAADHFYGEGNVTSDVLWDFSNADVSGLGSKQVVLLARDPRRATALRAGGRTALLAPPGLHFGLSRMFTSHTELMEFPFEVAAFTSKEEAMAWLGLERLQVPAA